MLIARPRLPHIMGLRHFVKEESGYKRADEKHALDCTTDNKGEVTRQADGVLQCCWDVIHDQVDLSQRGQR